MMQVIGVKRFIIIFILFSINLSLAAAIYLYLLPENRDTTRQLRVLRSQVNNVKSDISRIKLEFEQLDKQRDSFYALKESGFFYNQVRSDAKKIFSSIQEKSGVISAVVSVRSGEILDYAEAKKANHRVLRSPIEIEVRALDDISIYKYMDIVLQDLPGHLSFERVVISRLRDLSAPVLRAVASGITPELVRADIEMSWRTVIPTSEVIGDDKD